jgi:hypothetical protein
VLCYEQGIATLRRITDERLIELDRAAEHLVILSEQGTNLVEHAPRRL